MYVNPGSYAVVAGHVCYMYFKSIFISSHVLDIINVAKGSQLLTFLVNKPLISRKNTQPYLC